MSEINLKTWKRSKLLTSGFKDFAERETEEFLEPGDKHSFIVQYIISFSVYIKAQRDCCAHKQKCFPMPQRWWQAWLKLSVCSVLPEAWSWKAQSAQDPLLLLPAGVGNRSLLQSVQGGFVWWWGLSSQLQKCWVPDELHDVWFFWHCGFFFFSTCSCAIPQAEIFPVLSLNALAEFWRRSLAERRLFPFQAWGYQHGGVSSRADVAVCISFPSSLFVVLLIWKGLLVNHLPFLPLLPRDPIFKLLHFPYLKLHVFYRMEGFVLILLLRLICCQRSVCYILKISNNERESLALCSFFFGDNLQGFHVSEQRYSTSSERLFSQDCCWKVHHHTKASAWMYF